MAPACKSVLEVPLPVEAPAPELGALRGDRSLGRVYDRDRAAVAAIAIATASADYAKQHEAEVVSNAAGAG